MIRLGIFAVFIGILAINSSVPAIEVGDDASLRHALDNAEPGTRIQIAPGRYRAGIDVRDLHGSPEQPILIEAADLQNPPVFDGGSSGWHLIDCSYLVLRNLKIQGQSSNGINIDDGGSYETPSHHLLLENLHVSRIGPRGNHDGIKLSGVDDFVVRGCTIEGWAGEAIDMVGCHRGRIEGCRFFGREGFSQTTAVQAKGGSSEIVIHRCLFRDAAQRAVNIGGSTGMEFFRPRGVNYEARNITVEGCAFVGNMAPIAFVGVDGAQVRYNTLYRPDKWVARILQETTAPEFISCRGGKFENNLIVYRRADVNVFVNVGANTKPKTFRFAKNLWYCEDQPASSRPELPTPETEGVYGIDPELENPAENRFRPTTAKAVAYGAFALPTE